MAEIDLKHVSRGTRNKLQLAASGNNSVDALVMRSRPRELMQNEYDSYVPTFTNTGLKHDASLELPDGECSQAGFAETVSQMHSKKLK